MKLFSAKMEHWEGIFKADPLQNTQTYLNLVLKPTDSRGQAVFEHSGIDGRAARTISRAQTRVVEQVLCKTIVMVRLVLQHFFVQK
jgi:hypothetical protein